MPLSGDAKRAYNRAWMANARKAMRQATGEITKAVAKLPDNLIVETAKDLVPQVPQEALRLLLTKHKLPLELTLRTIRRLHRATRPYGRDSIMGPDNDARARGCELALKLHERAGTLPATIDADSKPHQARVRMIQFGSDGSQTCVEIG